MRGSAEDASGSSVERRKRGRSTLRDLQKDFTRKRIVESALTVFDERGFTRATMDDIAVEAGLNRATIYLHFKNKALILEHAVPTEDALRSGYEALGTAREPAEVRELFEITYDYWQSKVGRLWRHIREGATVDPTLAGLELEYARQQRVALQRVFEGWDVPGPQAAARAFAVYAVWSETIRHLGRGLEIPRADIVDVLTEQFVAARATPERG